MTDDTATATRVVIPMTPDLLEQVDNYRFTNRSPSRAAAIRELLEIALTVKTKDQSK
jgi:metal-responsive CopG/Arc/MetJ family transcriptional regulator